MKIERVSLFNSKRDLFIFVSILLFILSYTLLIEFHNYQSLTRFDSNIVNATVLKQYPKSKTTKTGKVKNYQVLKLKSDTGFTFYTTTKKEIPKLTAKTLELEIYTKDISFLEYLKIFYASSKILNTTTTLKHTLNQKIDSVHSDTNSSRIYQALYTATPLSHELQIVFSNLGISHLFAISGFHLGVLSFILFFLLKYPYSFLQSRFFPYRNAKKDSFIIISIALLAYLLFLDSPASLLRAFTMLLIGFILYDRGTKIISMQTLSLTVMILLVFFPRLLFELGFWLSVSGVFYIFLFLIHFKDKSKIWQFVFLPISVYFLMLPYSVAIFSNFSLYHPLSIIWTTFFSIFYPLSIVLHLIGQGDLLDSVIHLLIKLGSTHNSVVINYIWLYLQIFLSILSVFYKKALFSLMALSLTIFIFSLYQIL